MFETTWLRIQRKKAGFGRAEDLGNMLDPKVTGEAIRKWETEESVPRNRIHSIQLAKQLGVELDEILNYFEKVNFKLYEKRYGVNLQIGGDNHGQQVGGDYHGSAPAGEISLTAAEKMFILDNRNKGGDERLVRLMQEG